MWCGVVVGVGGEKRELELEEDAGLSSRGAAFGLTEDEVGVGRSLGSLYGCHFCAGIQGGRGK